MKMISSKIANRPSWIAETINVMPMKDENNNDAATIKAPEKVVSISSSLSSTHL